MRTVTVIPYRSALKLSLVPSQDSTFTEGGGFLGEEAVRRHFLWKLDLRRSQREHWTTSWSSMRESIINCSPLATPLKGPDIPSFQLPSPFSKMHDPFSKVIPLTLNSITQPANSKRLYRLHRRNLFAIHEHLHSLLKLDNFSVVT
ncbi:hypothetical protein Tco_0977494 [Tanacetum coccineum]|uniref:Uncharacterized protein n=1 Tax=Tanacetum coccineum TaxID=301880 RepID=A0ABQ5EKP9_9ASTR